MSYQPQPPHVSQDLWVQLYRLADEFYHLAPWKWLCDTDIFGIEDPFKAEVGYCCIMGNAKELYGVAIYRGSEGLTAMESMFRNEFKKEDMLYHQNALALTFDSKEFLQKDDLKVIREIDYYPPEKEMWPQFRSYLPGYHSWLFNEEEIRFMIMALQKIISFSNSIKGKESILYHPDSYLVHSLDQTGNWKERWVRPERKLTRPKLDFFISDIQIQKIKKMARHVPKEWELDLFFSPTVIAKEDRPFFPRMCLIADAESGFVLGHHLIDLQADIGLEIGRTFLDAMAKYQMIPKKVWVKVPELMSLLGPCCESLNIHLGLTDALRMVQEAQKAMLESFGDDSFGRPFLPFRIIESADEVEMVFEGEILDKGFCLCAQCGKRGKMGATIAPTPERPTILVLCKKCTIQESALREGSSYKEAQDKRKKMFATQHLLSDVVIERYQNLSGQKEIENLEEANEVLKCAQEWWNQDLTLDEKIRIETLPPKKQRDIFMKADMDLSQVYLKYKFKGVKIGRNDPCPCGSQKKYKKCCYLAMQ